MKGIQKNRCKNTGELYQLRLCFYIRNLTVNKTILRLKVKYSQEMREDTLGYMSPVEYRIANKGESA